MESAAKLFHSIEDRLNRLDQGMKDQQIALSHYQQMLQNCRSAQELQQQESATAHQRVNDNVTAILCRIDTMDVYFRTLSSGDYMDPQVRPMLANLQQGVHRLAADFVQLQTAFDELNRRVQVLEQTGFRADGPGEERDRDNDDEVRVLFRSAS